MTQCCNQDCNQGRTCPLRTGKAQDQQARIVQLEALLKFADERINKLVDAQSAPQQKGEWSREVVQGYLVIRSPLGDSYEFPLSMLADHFAQAAAKAVHDYPELPAGAEACAFNSYATVYDHDDMREYVDADRKLRAATQPAAQAVPVEVPTSTSADDANARYGEAYGVDWVYTAPAHSAEGVPAPVTVVDALQSLIEAIQFTPLGVRQIHAMERAREALAATHPTQQGLADLRWQIVHDHIGGEYIAGRACFVVQMPALPGANIMRGSVAEHFTKAVDAIAAQAKHGGV